MRYYLISLFGLIFTTTLLLFFWFEKQPKDKELACVQHHLKAFGYYDGPINGHLTMAVIDAAKQIKEIDNNALLPHIADLNNPKIWCEKITKFKVDRQEINVAVNNEEDPHILCIQQQLTGLKAYGGPLDGRENKELTDGLKAFASINEVASITTIGDLTYNDWCQRIGVLKPEMKKYWPSKELLDTKLTIKADDKYLAKDLAQKAYNEARDFYKHFYHVDIATPVGISVAADGEEAVENLNSLLRRQNATMDPFRRYWIQRCARQRTGQVDGMVFRHTIFLCNLSLTGQSAQDERTKASLLKTMVHEYMHLIQGELSKTGSRAKSTTFVSNNAAGWMIEGTAVYFTTRYLQKLGKPFMQESALRQRVGYNKKRLSDLAGRAGVRIYDDYLLAHQGVMLLARENGEDALFDYFRYLGKGYDGENAFKAAFSRSTKDFYKEFETNFR